MEDNEFAVCRLCLKIIRDSDFKLGNIELNMLDMLAPMNMCISNGSAICETCHEKLLACHEFKTICFEMDDRRNTLEEERLDSDNIKPTNVKLCSLCFGNLDDEMLKEIFLSESLILMLEKCLPELDVHRMDMAACSKCLKSLEVMFSFINECQITEEKVDKFCIAKNINKQNGLRLLDVIVFLQSYSVNIESSLTSSNHSNVISADDGFLVPNFELEPGQDEFKGAERNEEMLENASIMINPEAPQISNLISSSDFSHPEIKLEPVEDNHEFTGNNEESYRNVGPENCDNGINNTEHAQINNRLILPNHSCVSADDFNYKVKLESDQDVSGARPLTENFQRIIIKEEANDKQVKNNLNSFEVSSTNYSCHPIAKVQEQDVSTFMNFERNKHDVIMEDKNKCIEINQDKDVEGCKEICLNLEGNVNKLKGKFAERNEDNATKECSLLSSSSQDFIAPCHEFIKNNKVVESDKQNEEKIGEGFLPSGSCQGPSALATPDLINLGQALRTQQKSPVLDDCPDKKKMKTDNTQIKNNEISCDEVSSISGSDHPIVSTLTDFEKCRNEQRLMRNRLAEQVLQVGLKRRNWSSELMAELQALRPKGMLPYRRFTYRMRTGDGRFVRVRIPPLYASNHKDENVQTQVEELQKVDLKHESKGNCVDHEENITKFVERNDIKGCSSSQDFIAPDSELIINNQQAKVNQQSEEKRDKEFLPLDSGQDLSPLTMSDFVNLNQALRRKLEGPDLDDGSNKKKKSTDNPQSKNLSTSNCGETNSTSGSIHPFVKANFQRDTDILMDKYDYESKGVETSERKIRNSSPSASYQDLYAHSSGFINAKSNNLRAKELDSLSMHIMLVERLQQAGLDPSNWSPELMAQVQALRPKGSFPDRWITYQMRKTDGSYFRVKIPPLNLHFSDQNVDVEMKDLSALTIPNFVNLNQALKREPKSPNLDSSPNKRKKECALTTATKATNKDRISQGDLKLWSSQDVSEGNADKFIKEEPSENLHQKIVAPWHRCKLGPHSGFCAATIGVAEQINNSPYDSWSPDLSQRLAIFLPEGCHYNLIQKCRFLTVSGESVRITITPANLRLGGINEKFLEDECWDELIKSELRNIDITTQHIQMNEDETRKIAAAPLHRFPLSHRIATNWLAEQLLATSEPMDWSPILRQRLATLIPASYPDDAWLIPKLMTTTEQLLYIRICREMLGIKQEPRSLEHKQDTSEHFEGKQTELVPDNSGNAEKFIKKRPPSILCQKIIGPYHPCKLGFHTGFCAHTIGVAEQLRDQYFRWDRDLSQRLAIFLPKDCNCQTRRYRFVTVSGETVCVKFTPATLKLGGINEDFVKDKSWNELINSELKPEDTYTQHIQKDEGKIRNTMEELSLPAATSLHPFPPPRNIATNWLVEQLLAAPAPANWSPLLQQRLSTLIPASYPDDAWLIPEFTTPAGKTFYIKICRKMLRPEPKQDTSEHFDEQKSELVADISGKLEKIKKERSSSSLCQKVIGSYHSCKLGFHTGFCAHTIGVAEQLLDQYLKWGPDLRQRLAIFLPKDCNYKMRSYRFVTVSDKTVCFTFSPATLRLGGINEDFFKDKSWDELINPLSAATSLFPLTLPRRIAMNWLVEQLQAASIPANWSPMLRQRLATLIPASYPDDAWLIPQFITPARKFLYVRICKKMLRPEPKQDTSEQFKGKKSEIVADSSGNGEKFIKETPYN